VQVFDENITKIISRLSEYVDSQGLSFNKIAQKIGVSNSYFSKMVKSNGSLGEDIIRKILLEYENVSPDWLLTGDGPMLRTEPKKTTPGVCPAPGKCDQLEKDIKKLTQDLSKKCMDLTTALTDQQNKLTEIIASQQRLIEALTHKK
jgi:transcriptional regulator with XRE-family HTH domain